jgi:hypothetical protein
MGEEGEGVVYATDGRVVRCLRVRSSVGGSHGRRIAMMKGKGPHV